MTTDAEITGNVYRDCLNRVWVRTWQGWESASEPAIRKSIASIPGLVELVPVTDFERVVDYDKDEIWWSPSEDDHHYVNPGSEMESGCDWQPLYRRVTEPAESVTS